MLQMLWNFVIGTPSVVVIVAIAAFIATVKGTMWVTGVNARLNVLGNTQDKISAELKEFIGEVRAEFKEIRTELRGFSDRLASFSDRLTVVETTVTTLKAVLTEKGVIRSQSPLTLNERGETISQELNAPDLARRYAKKAKVPKSADSLQIQDMSVDYASNRLMDEVIIKDRKKIRNYSFCSGHSMEDVLTVIGFEMRDFILSERDPEAFKMVSRGLGKKKAGKKRAASSKSAKAA